MMPVIGLFYAPWALFSLDGAYAACKGYARWCMWTAGWIIGLRCEVRGTVPEGQVLVAAKHQSFLDILMIFQALSRTHRLTNGFVFKLPNLFIALQHPFDLIGKLMNDIHKLTA